MLHVYEFEVFEDEGLFLAFPFDMDGGTQGRDMAEVAEMAADWLQTEMEHRAMHGLPFPAPTFGNALEHGGERLVVPDGEGGPPGVFRGRRPHLDFARQRGGQEGGGPEIGAAEEGGRRAQRGIMPRKRERKGAKSGR